MRFDPNLQTWQLCSFFLTVERVWKNVYRHDLLHVSVVGNQERMSSFSLVERQCKECYSCWFTMDHSCSPICGLLLQSFQLPLLNVSIEGNVKKTALERICESSVVLWKYPSRTPLGQKGKQLHFTQAQLNLSKDFVDSSKMSVAGSSGEGNEGLKTRLASKANIV